MDWDVEMDDVSNLEGDVANITETRSREPIAQPWDGKESPSRIDLAGEGTTPVPNKIHIRGLDVLTTDEVKSYVGTHFGIVDKVEWIDDTSANLVFASESTAQDALVSLSAVPIADPTQLPALECLPAKPISAMPDVSLQVRFAVASDRKQTGAAARSRFYLLHPDYDPEERRRRGGGRSRYRERDSRSYGGRRGGRRHHSSEGDEGETGHDYFDASFYDDDEEALASRAGQRTKSPRRGIDRDGFEGTNSSKELFPDRQAGVRQRDRRRSRSASPARTRDRHQGGDILRGNRSGAELIKNRLAGENDIKELFPSKTSVLGVSQLDQLESATRSTRISDNTRPDSYQIKGMAANSDASGGGGFGLSIKGTAAAAATTSAKELFPDKFDGNAGKELFSSRLEGRGRPRQKAEDLFY